MKKIIITFVFIAFLYGCQQSNSVANNSNADSTHLQSPGNKATANAESLFVLPDTFQTQDGKNFSLAALSGKPAVVCMIFTHCGYACPRLTADMKNIADSLKGNREKVNFVLVSFDTERDNPAQLKKYQKQMDLDSGWILLHGSDPSVRTLSVLLNVQYEKDAEGNFSHSNLITVLDKTGAVAFQKEGLEVDHTETLEKINQLIK